MPSSPGAVAPEPLTLVLVSDDLLFPSRVREAVRPLGHILRVAGTEAALLTAVAAEPRPAAVLVNLTARRYDPLACIALLKNDPATRTLPVLAFAGHVEKDKHEAARGAGADMVAANSSVSLHLPALLARLLSGERPADVQDLEDDLAPA
jgi:CheY-like chemotaxis protein